MEREAIVRFRYSIGLRFAGGLAPARATVASFRLGLAASTLVDLIVIVLLLFSARRRKWIDVGRLSVIGGTCNVP